jgi:hypothetical protein
MAESFKSKKEIKKKKEKKREKMKERRLTLTGLLTEGLEG